MLPFVGLPREGDRAALPFTLSYLYFADVVLVALALVTLPRLAASIRDARDGEGRAWSVLFVLIIIALAVRPSIRGVDTVIRLVAAAALYRTIADLKDARRTTVAAVLGATAILQAVLGTLQIAAGRPLGLGWLGEIEDDLLSYGGPPLARGTLGHEFLLAALAGVTATILASEAIRAPRPWRWAVGESLAAVGAGLVYGRTVAIGVALVAGALVRDAIRSARHAAALAALLIGVGVPALLLSAGWAASMSRGVASDRAAMLLQATAVIADEPFFGVGPGRYLDVLRSRPELHVTREPQNVHNVPLMVAAEAGVPAGVVAILLLALAGAGALRAGTRARALYLAYVPWMVLDVLPYVTAQGIVLTAVWLAFLRSYRVAR